MILLKNVARVELPDDLKTTVLEMYVHYDRSGDYIRNYKYKDGVAYLPLNADKLKIVSRLTGQEIKDERNPGHPLSSPFVLNPEFKFRDHQPEAAAEMLEKIKSEKYGVLKAGCGCGKTVVMTWVAGHLERKILVMVDMGNLQTQWQEAFEIVWNKKADIITSKTKEFGDVCIVTFQLLHSNPELTLKLTKEFGCILLDEFHSAAAETRRDILFKMDSEYRIGCTATLMRKGFSNDVLTDMVSGVTVEMIDENALKADVHFIPTGSLFSFNDPEQWGKIMSKLSKDQNRNFEIAKVAAVNTKLGRVVLLVGITVESLKQVLKILEKVPECKPIVYTGSTSLKQDKELRRKVESGEINLVATSKKADKGLDLPRLDCLVLAKPSNNEAFVTQIAGRIVRAMKDKPTPVIYDMTDGGSLSRRIMKNRKKWYEKEGYNIVKELEDE